MNYKDQLQQAINNEDYERAEELKKLIESGEEFIYKNILITHGERNINYPDLTEKIKDSLDRTTRFLNNLAKGDKNLYKEYFEVPKPSAKLMNEYSKLGFSLEETTSLLNKLSNNPYKLKHRIKNLIKRIDWYHFISGILMGLIGYIYGITS